MKKTISLRPLTFALSMLLANGAYAVGQGTVTNGTGTIVTTGAATDVTQTSDRMTINWNNMDVAATDTLNFKQHKNTDAVLNRVASATPTEILGKLNANGKVFIVNPNGVLIGAGAQINVGSLVASSLDITDADFMAGNNHFSGTGTGRVVNSGTITSAGDVALLGGGEVTNNGNINIEKGNALLASGGDITLMLDLLTGHMNVKLNQGTVTALVNNGGIIITKTGSVKLTAWALDTVVRSVINNTGTIEATALTIAPAKVGNVELTSEGNGNITASGTIKGAAVINVKAANGDVSMAGALNALRDVNISAKNVVRTAKNTDSITAKESVNITAAQHINLTYVSGGSWVNLSAGLNLTIANFIADFYAGLKAGNQITLDRVTARVINSYSGGNTVLKGWVANSGSAKFEAENIQSANGTISSKGNVTVIARNNLDLKHVKALNANLTAQSGNLSVDSIVADYKIDLYAGKKAAVGALWAGNDANIAAGSEGILLKRDIVVTDDLTLRTRMGGNVIQAAASTLWVGDRLHFRLGWFGGKAQKENGANMTGIVYGGVDYFGPIFDWSPMDLFYWAWGEFPWKA
jgi:filamentous hemagglutinin family protein